MTPRFVLMVVAAFAAGLAFGATTAVFTNGLVVSGAVIGSGASTSAALEYQGDADAGLVCHRKGAANLVDECFIAFFAKDGSGTLRKSSSISGIWGDFNPSNGYSIVRYNATYAVNGVGVDDLSIRQFGGKGITLCGNSDADTPAFGLGLKVRCGAWLLGEVQLERPLSLANCISEPAAGVGLAQLYYGCDGSLKLKLGDGTVKTVVTQ